MGALEGTNCRAGLRANDSVDLAFEIAHIRQKLLQLLALTARQNLFVSGPRLHDRAKPH